MERILSSVLILPLIAAIIFWGSPPFFYFLILAVILLGTYEYFAMISKIGVDGFPILGLALSFLLTLCFYFDTRYFPEWFLVAITSLFLFWFLREKNVKVALDQIAYTFMGVLYVAGLLSFFILIRHLERGQYMVLFVMLVVWLGDTAAYYGGKKFGKRPLAPVISPNKTMEGAAAGLLASLIGGGIANLWFLQEIALFHCLIVALICGIIGQFGDCAESLLKRNTGVKDSGNLIPGHGGLLDRIDGLMFAGPAFYCYHQWIIAA